MEKPNAPFTLYTTLKSGPGRKVLALCRYLELEPVLELVDVYIGEGQRRDYLAINPFGKIPTLVEGDFALWESNAILLYLAEAHADYRLSSQDPRKRADIVRWMFWESAHFQPAFGPVLTEFVGGWLQRGRGAVDPGDVRWDQQPLQGLCEFLDARLRAEAHIAGAERSIADFAVAGMMTYARAARFPFARYPSLARWFDELAGLPAWQSTNCPLWDAL
jgi:glutathione S-transferase